MNAPVGEKRASLKSEKQAQGLGVNAIQAREEGSHVSGSSTVGMAGKKWAGWLLFYYYYRALSFKRKHTLDS